VLDRRKKRSNDENIFKKLEKVYNPQQKVIELRKQDFF